MSQRTERVDELLRQEIGAMLTRDLADPRLGFTTVTEVETTPDLRHAKVWVSVIGRPEERTEAVTALRHAVPFIRHELGRKLRLRRIPELHVVLDDTAERGTRILRLLSELEAGDAAITDAAPSMPDESLPTPVARLPHPGDETDEPPSAVAPPAPSRGRRHGPGRPAGRPAHQHRRGTHR